MKLFFRFLKHFWMVLKGSWKIFNDPELQELLKYKYVLFVAEKSTLNPKVACVRHFALYENFPCIEECVQLRNEVLQDVEEQDNDGPRIFWERGDRISSDDIIIVGLGPTDSDTFFRGVFCNFLSSINKTEEVEQISIV